MGNVQPAALDFELPLRLLSEVWIGGMMTDDEFIVAYRQLNAEQKARLKEILDVAPTATRQQPPAGTQVLRGIDAAGESRPHSGTAVLR